MFWNTRIYADAAGAMPPHANPGALHQEGLKAKKELEAARKLVAECIGAHADEIVFVASGTEANNLAATLAHGHAITSAIEHASVLEPLQHSGAEVTKVGVDQNGLLYPSSVTMAITPQTSFASIQLVNSEIGAVQPVREIAKELRRAKQKIYFHTDAAQAAWWLPLSVERLGVDLMTLESALYIRRGTKVLPLLYGGQQERGLRPGTEDVAAAVAFAKALHKAQQGTERRAKGVAAVRDYCWQEIKKLIPEAIVNGPALGEKRAPNNLNISIPGLEAQMAVIALDTLGIAASTRSACDVGQDEPSHVIKALGVPLELAGTAIRLSFLPTFSRRQARRVARALKEVAERYRRSS